MKGEQQLVKKLGCLVQDARLNVPLYREMYRGCGQISSVEDFAKLPILTNTILTSEKLESTFTDAAHLCITRTFEDDPRADGYVPRLLSYEDALGEYQVLKFFMKPINKRAKQKIMLIADDRHLYTIAELGKQLAYYEWPLATFIIRDQNISKLHSYLEWFRPTIVFLDVRGNLRVKGFPSSVKSLFTFNQRSGPENSSAYQSLKRVDIFRDNWAGHLAVSDGDEDHYRFAPDCFYFELSSDGALLVTSFIYRLQPVIRYKLSCRAVLTGKNGFALA